MTFSPGDRVHLAGLGTGVVLERRGRSRYAIELKGRIVIAAANDLQLAQRGRSPRRTGARVTQSDASDARDATHSPSLDLHGHTAVEAVALVEAFINDALLAGHRKVHIVHGRSGGRIRSAVQRYLRQLAAVDTFRLDPHNPGITIVIFA